MDQSQISHFPMLAEELDVPGQRTTSPAPDWGGAEANPPSPAVYSYFPISRHLSTFDPVSFRNSLSPPQKIKNKEGFTAMALMPSTFAAAFLLHRSQG